MTTNALPPSWAELALRAFLSERDFESVSGDLLEEYRETIYGNRGRVRANVWYVAQVLGFAWRHAGAWAVIFAVAFLARVVMDWHMPTGDFQTRSAVSTLLGFGIFIVTGFWAGSRSGSYIAGAVVGMAVATLAIPIQLVGAALLLAGWHDPSVLAAIRSSGGLGEVFTMPLFTVLPGILFGLIGGALGAKTRRLRTNGGIVRLCAFAWLVGATNVQVVAQSPGSIDLNTIGKDSRWKIVGRTVSEADIKGKHAVHISESGGVGVVWLDGYNLTNGTIDVDLLGRSAPVQGSFVGIAFRVVDALTYDAVYFRPFNFRATDSTRHAHAVEYVSHPQWTWERLRAEHPGQYEQPLAPAPDGDEWFHARIVVARPKVSVFVNGATQPSLVVNELSDRTNGSIGLWVGQDSGGYFANLRVTPAQ